MRTQKEWFEEYAESHQNKLNQSIHYICVPIIYFSIVGLLMAVDNHLLIRYSPVKHPLIANWATVVIIFLLLFYYRLSSKTFIRMLLFSIFSLVVNYYLSRYVSLFIFNLILFILAWIGQFYGHKVEGKKPSFFKDIQFLLIGPAWVFEKIFSKTK